MVHGLAPSNAVGFHAIGSQGRDGTVSQAPNSAEEGDDTAAIRGGCNAKWVVESLPHRPVLKKSSRDQHQRVLVRRDCGFRFKEALDDVLKCV
jgi:hypothetical protein